MNLTVVSDLHVEFHRDNGKSFIKSLSRQLHNPDGVNPDILVLAGDIATNADQLETVFDAASGLFREVLYVAGNHEYYHHTKEETIKYIEQTCGLFKNVHFLNGHTMEILGVKFHGCTLWYKEHPDSVLLEDKLGDFQYIKNHKRFFYKQHETEAAWLKSIVKPGDVVITHMAPSAMSINSQFSMSDVNNFFYTNLEDVIFKNKPKLWMHGHIHNSFSYQIGSTRVVCNPLGYVGIDENVEFNDRLEIKV